MEENLKKLEKWNVMFFSTQVFGTTITILTIVVYLSFSCHYTVNAFNLKSRKTLNMHTF